METTINFRISFEQKDHLEALGEVRGEKISAIVREIITDYLLDYDYEDNYLGVMEEINITLPDVNSFNR